MHEAFYFGPSGRQIFATYHPPRGGNGRVLTVICPPLFSDYTRTQLALRKLAISLTESGQHALRFDYRGTGDSFGDLGEVAVSDWVEDIALATQEGREVSGASVVRLLGVRAGALLTCALAATNGVQRLVLWDPVPEGAGYLESLRRKQARSIEKNLYLTRLERNKAINEYAGYYLSNRLSKELSLLEANTYSTVPKERVYVVNTSSIQIIPENCASEEVVPFACQWDKDTEDILVPKIVLERLVACLTMF